jgi:hypothetical protein
MSLQEVNFYTLLSDELHEINLIYKKKEEQIRPIIEASCTKLEPYFDNPREICAALCKVFPKIADRDIRQYCPDKYKREYVKEEIQNSPVDFLDEALKHMEDVLHDAESIIHEIRTAYKKADRTQKEELTKIILDAFGGLTELKKRGAEWKELSVELAKIKIIHDKRKKMDYFTKFMRRLQTFYLSKNRVAELAGISSKWVKTGFQDLDDIEELAQKIWKTDKSFAEIADWFNENVLRQERNLPYVPLISEDKF